jgi:hypothetical protein
MSSIHGYPVQFSLGRTLITPGARDAIEEAGQLPAEFLRRHATADWGDLSSEDAKENDVALEHGFRLLSAYRTRAGVKLWVITEADRSATTILLPDEY